MTARKPPAQPAASPAAAFRSGWQAALVAVREWHQAQAIMALREARLSRFPKTLERAAELHQRAADQVMTLDPDDV